MKQVRYKTVGYFYGLLLLICSMVVSCDSHQKQHKKVQNSKITIRFPKPDKSEMKQKKIAIHNYFMKYLKRSGFVSGQFLVAKNGKVIYYQKTGVANIRQQIPMRANIPLHVASLSKVVTALAVLRLADQKKIKLDADVRRYLKQFPYPDITVRMLLNHRSGIPYYGYFTEKIWDQTKMLTNQDILRLLKTKHIPLNFKQNTHFAYSNTNYALLALIVEKITCDKFPNALKSLVFSPLNMNHSFVASGKKMVSCTAQSYNSRGQLQAINYLDGVYGDKNLYTTALDLLKLDMATYSEQFISDSLIRQMFRGYSYELPGMRNYGLGIRMREMEGKKPYFFHSGWWHGNTACYASLRSDTVCVVALSNIYTRSVYSINRIAPIFGNYPFDFAD